MFCSEHFDLRKEYSKKGVFERIDTSVNVKNALYAHIPCFMFIYTLYNDVLNIIIFQGGSLQF